MNDVLDLLADDHDALCSLLRRIGAPDVDRRRRIELVESLEERWFAHVDAENAVLSSCPLTEQQWPVADRVRGRHAAVERILDRFGALAPEEPAWLPLLAVLREQVTEHIAVEEAELRRTFADRLGAEARRVLAVEYQSVLRELAA